MPSNSVIVIGGGLAGLSSGVALAEAGFRVRLLEKRPHLGGRATSYLLPSGEHVDNCQHVTLGCCTNLDDFYRRVGAAHKIRTYCRLLFADSVGRRGVIEASFLAPPFHLAPSFALFPSLTWADKHPIAHALLRIARSGGRPAELDGAGGATMSSAAPTRATAWMFSGKRSWPIAADSSWASRRCHSASSTATAQAPSSAGAGKCARVRGCARSALRKAASRACAWRTAKRPPRISTSPLCPMTCCPPCCLRR